VPNVPLAFDVALHDVPQLLPSWLELEDEGD
jgi:hypothetical protein